MSLFGDIIKAIPHAAHLQDRVRELEAEHAALETENAILKDKIRDAQSEIVQLKKEIERFTHKVDLYEAGLDETESKILAFLAQRGDGSFEPHIREALQIQPTLLKFYLTKLKDDGFIKHVKQRITMPVRIFLTQQGREYAIKHGLIADS